jgi:hypothetical protein
MSFVKFAFTALFGVTVACVAPPPTEENGPEQRAPAPTAPKESVLVPASLADPAVFSGCGFECTTTPNLYNLSWASCVAICDGGAASCEALPPPPC